MDIMESIGKIDGGLEYEDFAAAFARIDQETGEYTMTPAKPF